MEKPTTPADDRVHSAEDHEEQIEKREELENKDLPEDQEERLDSHI